MQIGDFLYSVIILPIEAVIEFVFNFSISKMSMLGAGGAIILVSLTVNFLALPLYNIADESGAPSGLPGDSGGPVDFQPSAAMDPRPDL